MHFCQKKKKKRPETLEISEYAEAAQLCSWIISTMSGKRKQNKPKLVIRNAVLWKLILIQLLIGACSSESRGLKYLFNGTEEFTISCQGLMAKSLGREGGCMSKNTENIKEKETNCFVMYRLMRALMLTLFRLRKTEKFIWCLVFLQRPI